MDLAQRLKEFRAAKGLTQKDIAEKAGIHHVTIRKYETRVMEPKLTHIDKLANALNISKFAFLGAEESGLKFEARGDFYTLIFMLLEADILKFCLDKDEVEFSFNPLLLNLFTMTSGSSIPQKSLFKLKDMDDEFAQWVNLKLSLSENEFSKMSVEEQNDLKDRIEHLEIVLMSSSEKL